LLDLLAARLGVVTPVDATAGAKIVAFFAAGVVLAAAVVCIGWVWLPYIRPRARAPEVSSPPAGTPTGSPLN
jgi:hypothetical protein